jgi:hypothetical protein
MQFTTGVPSIPQALGVPLRTVSFCDISTCVSLKNELCHDSWRPTAASTTTRSAPPAQEVRLGKKEPVCVPCTDSYVRMNERYP